MILPFWTLRTITHKWALRLQMERKRQMSVANRNQRILLTRLRGLGEHD